MILRVAVLALCSLVAGSAQAAVLRISAEPPLSVERLADALRSYVEGVELDFAPEPSKRDGVAATPGVVEISLRRLGTSDDEVELVLLDGEETILSRLPRAMRSEDLYRSAALKVHALLERRSSSPTAPGDALGVRETAAGNPPERLMLDAGFAVLAPSAGPVRQGLRLAAGLRLGRRGHLLLGAYIESGQSTRVNDIDVSSWELPILLQAGLDWHQGTWAGWVDVVGHAAVRRVSAKSPDIDSHSALALSPRAGGCTGLGFAIGQGLRLQAQMSLLATLADTRYWVDGQTVSPSAKALSVIEVGLVYGGR
jgi:hypothetical protein